MLTCIYDPYLTRFSQSMCLPVPFCVSACVYLCTCARHCSSVSETVFSELVSIPSIETFITISQYHNSYMTKNSNWCPMQDIILDVYVSVYIYQVFLFVNWFGNIFMDLHKRNSIAKCLRLFPINKLLILMINFNYIVSLAGKKSIPLRDCCSSVRLQFIQSNLYASITYVFLFSHS